MLKQMMIDLDDSIKINNYDDDIYETDNDTKDDTDDDSDYYAEDKLYDLDDRLENFCEMTDEEKRQFFADHPRLEQFTDRLAN